MFILFVLFAPLILFIILFNKSYPNTITVYLSVRSTSSSFSTTPLFFIQSISLVCSTFRSFPVF
jgi:hypothetical protein